MKKILPGQVYSLRQSVLCTVRWGKWIDDLGRTRYLVRPHGNWPDIWAVESELFPKDDLSKRAKDLTDDPNEDFGGEEVSPWVKRVLGMDVSDDIL